uniref:CSON010852 protein n=1 Tax=Culicoides sonorensis TaxID=179676 RepID=A0A336LQZ2_CULSO
MLYTVAPQPDMASRSNALIIACAIISNKSVGSKSGFHNVSHMPNNCSAQVPATTKSFGISAHPIKSMVQIKGSNVFGVNPAITGSTKYGPNRLSYKKLDNIAANTFGSITRFSRTSYKFLRNISFSWTTVAPQPDMASRSNALIIA